MVANFLGDFLEESFYELNGVDDRPDFFNFRCLSLDVLTGVRSQNCVDMSFVTEAFLSFYK